MVSKEEETTDNVSDLSAVKDLPDSRVLEDKTPDWIRMSGGSVLFVLTLGTLMITIFSSRPLWPTDLWDHVNYGSWMMAHGRIPYTEPLLALAEGVPVVTSAWLSQLGLFTLFSAYGFAGLQFAYGLLVVLPLGIVATGGVSRSGSVVFGFVALFSCMALNWQQLLVIRPQLVGFLCYSMLVTWLLTVRRWRRAVWVLLPVMFGIWANSHGSFAIGLMTMALAGLAHAITIGVRTKSIGAGISNQRFVRLLLLTQLCAAAALVNPNGLLIFTEVLRVGRHPNIESMFEWSPLTLRMHQGRMAAALGLLLIVVLRWSPRRLRLDESILLVFTAGMTLWSSRMINWLAPVMGLTLAGHGAAAWRRFRSIGRTTEMTQRTGLWGLANIGLCWIFFAMTTLGVQVVHGRRVSIDRAVSSQTPVSAAEFLNSQRSLPEGLVFCSAEWSGFLQRFGPKGFRPMVNLHVHVIPEQVWTHYQRLAAGSEDWRCLTEIYGVNLAVTDKSRHELLIDALRKSEHWVKVFEDAQTVIYKREPSKHQIFESDEVS
ncbi:MAG: hypothetical protein MK110_05380 [Fuerstiella sp.]|nr:hypothetical protein [Fuerstiella sp.]